MAEPTPEEAYLSELSKLPAGHPIHKVLEGEDTGRPRIHCHEFALSAQPNAATLEDLISWEKQIRVPSVCVVENIPLKWMAKLVVAWELNQAFYPEYIIGHRDRPLAEDESLWHSCMTGSARGWPSHSTAFAPYDHIDGIVPHLAGLSNRSGSARLHEYSQRYGWQCATRISYYRVQRMLYLFLVDAPFSPGEPDGRWLAPSKLSLWVPYSNNRGGLPIPQLYSATVCAPFELIRSFLGHGRHASVLFESGVKARDKAGHVTANPVTLSQSLAASLWRTNLDFIDQEVKRIAFRDLRRPNLQTNDRLHNLREDLNTLRDQTKLARDYLIGGWKSGDDPISQTEEVLMSPTDMLQEVLDRVPHTERFLMDTFQLLMSSISVMDAQSSIEQSRRNALLTQLATVYVPLSLVTGIWGMNVKEINDSPHPMSMVWVTLVLASVGAAALLMLLRHWEQIARSCRKRLQKRPMKIEEDEFEMPKRMQSKLV